MTIAMLLDNAEGSQEIYEKVRSQLELPAGGIFHVAGPAPSGGWRVIELWDSQETASKFLQEQLVPALKAAGGATQPPSVQFWPVHAYMSPADQAS